LMGILESLQKDFPASKSTLDRIMQTLKNWAVFVRHQIYS
jgi:hypothetical protein